MTLVTLTAYDMCGASGFLSQAFTPFEQLGISVDLIATSQYSISVTLDHIPVRGGFDVKRILLTYYRVAWMASHSEL